MKKEYTLLSGEVVLLGELSKTERGVIKSMRKLIKDDPEGDGAGNYFELAKVSIRFGRSELCKKVLLDVARRAGIAQNIIAAPEYQEEVARFHKKFSIIPFATAVRHSRLQFSELRKLLNDGVIEGIMVGNVWFVVFASLNSYINSRKRN